MAAKKKRKKKVDPAVEQANKIATHIVAISRGFREVMKGPLTEEVIVTLIHHKTRIPRRTIKQVLEATESLEDWCVKKGVPLK